MKDLRLAADQIGGNAGEGNWHIVEALDLGVGKRNLIENQRHLLAGVKSPGELQPLAQPEFQGVGIVAGILFTAEGQVVEGSLAGHHLVPVDAVYDLANLGGIPAGGIDPADQSAHAGSGDIVYRDMVLFQPGMTPTWARGRGRPHLAGRTQGWMLLGSRLVLRETGSEPRTVKRAQEAQHGFHAYRNTLQRRLP